MAIIQFKEKTNTIMGIDVESPVAQAAEISDLIGATSFIVDTVSNSAQLIVDGTQFSVDGEPIAETYTVTAGQVVSVTNGVVSVMDRAEFYGKFEAHGAY